MNNSEIKGIGITSERTRKRLANELSHQGISNDSVLKAIVDIPRHIFVDEALAYRAYENLPLPIGFGQTISQPYIVARMTEALVDTGNTNKVLEIGTGSGYQSAILSQLCNKVYTVERIKALLNLAKSKFSKLRLHNIYTKYDDGNVGWKEHAPYDGIVVTCAATEIPTELLAQLKDGGSMIIPVAVGNDSQQLQIVTKHNNDYTTTHLELVRFVPLLPGIE